MNKAVLLFSGYSLPYHVLDYGIDWAKENEGKLEVMFLIPGEMPDEGYLFPSDLDEAESLNTAEDSEKGLLRILQRESKFIEKRAGANDVPVNTRILRSPELNEVIQACNGSEMVLIDKEMDEDSLLNSALKFTMADLKEHAELHFIEVGTHDRFGETFY